MGRQTDGIAVASTVLAMRALRRAVKINKNDLKRKTKKSIKQSHSLECGPMPSVMAALPNIGGALCSTAAKFR